MRWLQLARHLHTQPTQSIQLDHLLKTHKFTDAVVLLNAIESPTLRIYERMLTSMLATPPGETSTEQYGSIDTANEIYRKMPSSFRSSPVIQRAFMIYFQGTGQHSNVITHFSCSNSHDISMLTIMMGSLLKLGKTDQALALVHELEESKKADIYFYRALVQGLLGNNETALAMKYYQCHLAPLLVKTEYDYQLLLQIHCKNNRANEAYAVWQELSSCYTPSPHSRAILMNAVIEAGGDPTVVVAQKGLSNSIPPMIAYNSLLQKYFISGNFAKGLKVFCDIKANSKPDRYSFETALKIYVQKNDLKSFSETLQLMQDSGFSVTDYTLCSVMMYLSLQKKTVALESVAFEFIKRIQSSPGFTRYPNLPWTLRMKYYSRQGQYQEVVNLFNNLVKSNNPCRFSLSLYIRALLRLNMYDRVSAVLKSDAVINIVGHERFFDIQLGALFHIGDREGLEATYSRMCKHHTPSLFATQLLERIKLKNNLYSLANIVSIREIAETTAAEAVVPIESGANSPELAVDPPSTSKSQKVSPTLFLKSRTPKTHKVPTTLLQNLKPVQKPKSLFDYNRLIHMYYKSGRYTTAVNTFKQLSLTYKPDKYSYEALLKIYARRNDLEMFSKSLQAMQSQGIPFSDFTLSTLMDYFSRQNKQQSLEEIAKEFSQRANADPKFTSFPTLPWVIQMRHFYRRKCHNEVVGVFQNLSKNMEPCRHSLAMYLKSLVELGRPEKVMMTAKSELVFKKADNAHFYNILLEIALKYHEVDYFVSTFKRLLAVCKPNEKSNQLLELMYKQIKHGDLRLQQT